MGIRRQIGAVVTACATVATACGGDAANQVPGSDDALTAASETATSEDSDVRVELPCGRIMPVFFDEQSGLISGGIDGTTGPAAASIPERPGQLVAHWKADFGVTIEVRWPGTPIPSAAPVTAWATDHFSVEVSPLNPDADTERVVANLQVSTDSDDPCSLISIEAFAPRPDPIMDHLAAFIFGLRPSSEKADYLAAGRSAVSRSGPSSRPAGQCSVAVAARFDDMGGVSDDVSTAFLLVFLSDRLEEKASEPCLSESALAAYSAGPAIGDVPGPCLYSCDAYRLVGGSAQASEYGRASLLVDYETASGDVIQLRESFQLQADESGDVLITSVEIGPDSYLDVDVARRVINDFLDAVAAGEYSIASRYLFNESTPTEVDERIGLYEDAESFNRLFGKFCETAACASAFVVGPAINLSMLTRTIAVQFSTAAGLVDVPIGVGTWEAVATLINLPPEGTGTGVTRPDVRIFGTTYDSDLTVVRMRAVERYRDGIVSWVGDYRVGRTDRFQIAADYLVASGHPADEGGFEAFVPSGSAGYAEPINFFGRGDGRASFAGASTVGDRPIAFLLTEDEGLLATDLDTGSQWPLFAADVGVRTSDESPYFADVGGDRVVALMIAGESSTLEVHSLDPDSLVARSLVSRIQPEGSVGEGHISPDGRAVAATLDPSFYDPIQTVALFDVDSTEVIGRWTVDGDETIDNIDYDGRYIVAHLSDSTLWVIDTSDGTTRLVDMPVQVIFG